MRKCLSAVAVLFIISFGLISGVSYGGDLKDDISVGSLQERIEEHRNKLIELRQRRVELERDKFLLTTEIEQDLDKINFLSANSQVVLPKQAAAADFVEHSVKAAADEPIDEESRVYIDDLSRMKQDLLREKELLQQAIE